MAVNYTVRKIDRLLRFDTTGDDIVATLLPFVQTPNASYEVHRISLGDGHTVTLQVAAAPDFLMPDGSTAIVLDDTTPSALIKIPADGASPAFVTMGGTGGGGGGTSGVPAPPVVIGAGNVREVYNGKFEITVDWTAGSGAPTKGVAVFLEDPDISALAEAPMDGTMPLDGTSGLSGKWTPKRETDSFESPALLSLNGQPKARNVRVYLEAYGTANGTLVRANKASPTPNVVVTIPAATGESVSGQEYAWVVTNANITVVNDFDNAAGPMYSLLFDYTAPDPALPLPPGMRAFGGVMTVYEYDDGTQKEALFLDVGKPQDWHSGSYEAGAGGHFKVWFPSRDVDGRRNSIVKGVTPMIDVTIVYPPAGQPSAPYITNFTLTPQPHQPQPDGTILAVATLNWTPSTSPRFSLVTFYRTGVTPPRKFTSAGANVTSTNLTVVDWPTATQAWTITAISRDTLGRDSDLPTAPSAAAPKVTWNIGPPGMGSTGGEYTNGQAGVGITTITTEQQLGSDGVVVMRHKIVGWTNPTDNTFGGMSIARVFSGDLVNATIWDAAKSATSFTTDWEPAPTARTWDFYFVSRDMSNKRNTIVPGFTPKVTHTYTPIANAIIPSRLPTGWWDPAEFQWPTYPTGYFQALSFVAKKIFVGSILRVGGGTGVNDATFGAQSNGQIAVYNSTNVLRGWIGQQDSVGTPDNPGLHSVYGAWFSELYVGGTSPVNAPLYANSAGVLIVGGFDVSGSQYPYISIRDNTGVEVGRLGARIGYAASGNQSGSELSIQGAWFREFAYGGQSFTDWRMLAKMDATAQTGATVQMRNINKFSIDYMQNYPSASNPTNAAMHLEFGYDSFGEIAATGTQYWKFPGLAIYRTGTNPLHGIALINRGIVLRGPNNVAGNGGRIASLVSYNGDPLGSDSTASNRWWGELTMYSPSSGAINVDLGSGSATDGGSFLVMRDGSGSFTNFSVDNAGNVTIRGTLSLASLSLSGTLGVTGTTTLGAVNAGAIGGSSLNITGTSTLATINGSNLVLSAGINCQAINANGQTVTCGAVNAGSGNGNFGTVFCSSVSAGTGAVNCGSVNAGVGNVTCGTLTVSSGFTNLTTTGLVTATSFRSADQPGNAISETIGPIALSGGGVVYLYFKNGLYYLHTN